MTHQQGNSFWGFILIFTLFAQIHLYPELGCHCIKI